MSIFVTVLLASWLAGILSFLGGFIAWAERTKDTTAKRKLVHGVMAFGGGLLLSAIAFALTPGALSVLNPPKLVLYFCLGGLLFCGIDILLARQGGSRAQFMAMMMDFVPEAISMGAVSGYNPQLGILLALFIGAQNLPEGFNAYRELLTLGTRPRTALAALAIASIAGPISAGLGYLFLQDMPSLTASIMIFASGGILYLVFQDIAPASKIRHHWAPALGSVLGFAVGLLGTKLLG